MHQPGTFVTLPAFALEQRHVARGQAVDKLFIDNFSLRSAKQPTVQAGLVQPFAGAPW